MIALLAALARLAYLAAARPSFTGVPWALADGLLHDHSLGLAGHPTTDYEPLYPLFLAACRVLAFDRGPVVQLLQVVVASLGAVCIYRLASSLANDERVAALAGILFALDPLLVRESALLSESALATTLLLAFVAKTAALETATDAAIAGVCLGATILARTAALPILPLAAIMMAASRQIRPALTVTVTALLVAPLPIRNHLVNGSWWPTRSGLNLFVGNSPYSAALIPGDDVDLLQPYAAAIVRRSTSLSSDDVRFDRAADEVLARRALAWMRASPAAALALKVRNVGYLLSPRIVPYRTATEATRAVIDADGRFVGVEHPRSRPPLVVAGYAVWQSMVLIATAFGVYRRRGDFFRRDRFLWCVAATFLAVHALYFPATRYRAPMEFVLLFFGAVGLQPALEAGAAFARHRDRRTVLEAASALVAVRVGLWTLPYSAVARLVAGRGVRLRTAGVPGDTNRIAAAVTGVARRLPWMTCLVEALAAQALLRRRGYESSMRFGVRSGETVGRAIDAHAWLVCDGRVVVGDVDVDGARRYETLERVT
ncbi:MAG TPA: lasso peptide biosynthesis B2 protein [Vicinamibacterales bacterium]|nr:lasso peptide biosynthesis B2 protein [Vicinamibacterales bacterium]